MDKGGVAQNSLGNEKFIQISRVLKIKKPVCFMYRLSIIL